MKRGGMGLTWDKAEFRRKYPCKNQRQMAVEGTVQRSGWEHGWPSSEWQREGNLDSSVSRCALCSWGPADKLVLMAMGHKAMLTASPGCLSLRGSSAFPRFYDLKLSGEGGKP